MIGRITPAGTGLVEFPTPTERSGPTGIAVVADGNLWFTENTGHRIGRITPTGSIKEFKTGAPHAAPVGITRGPGGTIWFADYGTDHIGSITMEGAVARYKVHGHGFFAGPFDIAFGPTETCGSRSSTRCGATPSFASRPRVT
jgi:virginiamycin B lyase